MKSESINKFRSLRKWCKSEINFIRGWEFQENGKTFKKKLIKGLYILSLIKFYGTKLNIVVNQNFTDN